jgi:hypothetical protein
VGFKQDKLVKRLFVDGKKKDILNRLNRTKREEFPDLQAQRQDYDREVAGEKRQQRKVRLSLTIFIVDSHSLVPSPCASIARHHSRTSARCACRIR